MWVLTCHSKNHQIHSSQTTSKVRVTIFKKPVQAITVSTSVTTSNKAECDDEQCLGEQVVYIQVFKNLCINYHFFPNIEVAFLNWFTLKLLISTLSIMN